MAWERALTELVQQRGAALKRYGFLLCGDSGDAEDLVQDALVRTFSSARHPDIAQLEGYVRKVMLNLYLDRDRRRRVFRRLLPLTVPPAPPDRHAESEVRGDLRRALQRLSPRQRACVVLHYYLDLPIPECADALRVSPGAVKRYLHESRARLAEQLGGPPDRDREDGYAAS
ncbi:sigma-70 family RNA polymerase sigma factor [Dactylosporangium cerinum]|uniref:Sigma-70 family RNA polymerase sigma factor n=1 Tax=Dactylosporangium cerinum TaxID=1434730 RepID=A0ABV9VLP3_9ACTN